MTAAQTISRRVVFEQCNRALPGDVGDRLIVTQSRIVMEAVPGAGIGVLENLGIDVILFDRSTYRLIGIRTFTMALAVNFCKRSTKKALLDIRRRREAGFATPEQPKTVAGDHGIGPVADERWQHASDGKPGPRRPEPFEHAN